MLSAMANAMLEDDFKSSHPDLTVMNEQREDDESSNNNKTRALLGGRIGMQQRLGASPMRKSVEFAIEPPPVKRSRPDVPWTAKQVVDGVCKRCLIVCALEYVVNVSLLCRLPP